MKIDLIKELKIPEKEIELGKEKVKVKQYLPAEDKSNILSAIEEICFRDGLIDQAKIDALLNVFIMLNYTNIEFESRDEEELLRFYDYMEINNYTASIINAIPKIEYDALIGYYENTINDFNRYKNSSMAAISSVLSNLPVLMEKISEISKEIDLDAIAMVSNIANTFN